MSANRALLTINYKLDTAKNFVSSVDDGNYYFFAANHLNANAVPRPFDNEQDTLMSSYDGMVFGKRIRSNDTNLMIRRIDWTTGTVYDAYDNTDDTLYDKEFYVVIHEGTQWDVFKCLENGGGKPSTVAPSRANVSSNNEDFYYPNDGYRWKYMYTISDTDFDKFSTNEYMPVFDDAGVQSAAIPGAIDTIKIVSPGVGYSNYLNGSFGVGDIRLNGDSRKYGISVTGTKTVNGYYNYCWLYIASGPGSGQYRQIISYNSNTTHNFITLDTPFDNSDQPQNGSVFEITPSVIIEGDGRETLPATARAIINPSSNTVSRIEMIDKGRNYFNASAYVAAAAPVGASTGAYVVPILSPVGGHGYSASAELGCRFAAISVKLVGSESNTIITDNDYSQIGILKNPAFRSVELTVTGNRDFYTSEPVYKVNTQQLAGTVKSVLNGNNELTSTMTVVGANAHSITKVGDLLMISDESRYQISNVTAVANNSITLRDQLLWDTGAGSANVFLTWAGTRGEVEAFSAGAVTLTNVVGELSSGDRIIGDTTGVYAQINTVKIGGVSKTFDTFVQTYTYIGSMSQGNFTQDELVYQIDPADASARFHSIANDPVTGTKRIYVTSQKNTFNTGNSGPTNEIRGSSSGAIAQLTNKYLPDLIYGSGEVVYIEYGDSITRVAEKSESFKLIFAF